MDTGLLIARVVFGLLMAAHGAQKLFGWFGGYGLAGTGGFFEQLGFRPGRLFAAAAGGDRNRRRTAGRVRPARPARPGADRLGDDRRGGDGALAARPVRVRTTALKCRCSTASAALTLALTGYGAFSLDAALA